MEIMEKSVIEYFKQREEMYNEGKRLGLMADARARVPLHGRVLEVGCGTTFSYLGARDIEPYGLDIIQNALKSFKANHPSAEVILGDVRRLPFRNESFDGVVADVVLHHLVGGTRMACTRNILLATKEVRRVLTRNGTIVIRELLVRNRVWSSLMYYITLFASRTHLEMGWLRICANVVTYFLTSEKIEHLMKKCKLSHKVVSQRQWRLLGVPLGHQVILTAEKPSLQDCSSIDQAHPSS